VPPLACRVSKPRESAAASGRHRRPLASGWWYAARRRGVVAFRDGTATSSYATSRLSERLAAKSLLWPVVRWIAPPACCPARGPSCTPPRRRYHRRETGGRPSVGSEGAAQCRRATVPPPASVKTARVNSAEHGAPRACVEHRHDDLCSARHVEHDPRRARPRRRQRGSDPRHVPRPMDNRVLLPVPGAPRNDGRSPSTVGGRAPMLSRLENAAAVRPVGRRW